jgi:hypothetical protein
MDAAYTRSIVSDENAAREALESVRGPTGPVCQHFPLYGALFALRARS